MKSRGAQKSHRGVIVPMVTPLQEEGGALDPAAVVRVVEHLAEGRVHGVFVLGTTGESLSVPTAAKIRLVEMVTACAKGRMRVYAGISSDSLEECVHFGNDYLSAGVDAVVAHAPRHCEPQATLPFFTELADRLKGDLIIYNIPLTTQLSLPIDVCKHSASRPGIVGIKDSENNIQRLDQLLQELGGQESFSVFIGTGILMARGLLQGADGIVPSVGNLVPGLCRQLYDCVLQKRATEAEALHRRLMEIAGVYQNGRTLGESLAALKAAMHCLGLCRPEVFPPLKAADATTRSAVRAELVGLGLPLADAATPQRPVPSRATLPLTGGWNQALPADPG